MAFRSRERAGRSTAWTFIPVVIATVFLTILFAPVALAEWRSPASTTITLSSDSHYESGAPDARRLLSRLPIEQGDSGTFARRLVALPECDSAGVDAVRLDGHSLPADLASRIARVEDIVQIREQTVAVVSIDSGALLAEQTRLGLSGAVEIVVAPRNARGAISRNTGPFTAVCERAILNYEAVGDEAPSWYPPSSPEERRASVTYCGTVGDCAAAGVDLLLVVAEEFHYSGLVQAYAAHHAVYLGLNVGIVGTSALDDLTAEGLRGFIQGVYDTQSAANFGDGHLGFVVLVGDAYADDNVTVLIPTYDGYGGTEVASDHYYACVSGDDDFEDVMIGRLSVGNSAELSAVISKCMNYMPLPSSEAWRERTLLVSGLFYTSRDEYVALFDEYEALMPDDWTVDRIYRHDYDSNHDCSVDVVSAFNDGHLIVNYAGDGWISSWHQVMDTTDIPFLNNRDRLPIVLSMACMTGWYDNITEIDQTGSYDCFAEQIVNAEGDGAIACLASPRASDGGMFRTLTKCIYRAAFSENCVFLGETMAVAKLLHIQDGGSIDYARHFNLFGDPALIYRWDAPPTARVELATRPGEIVRDPEFPAVGDDMTLTIRVRNTSALAAEGVEVRVSDISASGTYSKDIRIPMIDDWSFEDIAVTIRSLSGGPHTINVTVDPENTLAEMDETNNDTAFDMYVYPHVAGFPAQTGTNPRGPCVARLNGGAQHLFLMEDDAVVRAIDSSGQTAWTTDPAMTPADYGPEIAPAVGDLDGDGINEVIATKRMGLMAFGHDGQPVWNIVTDDPVGSPVLVDADSDGDLDVIIATKMFFGGSSKIIAVDEDGSLIWSYSLPSGDPASATPVAGDFDQDGTVDFAFGTSAGYVGAVSCAQVPPVQLWPPTRLCEEAISTLGLGDVDDDGTLEIVAGGENAYSLNSEDGTENWTALLDTVAVAMAIGDIDDDGVAEVVVGTASGTVYSLNAGTELWSTLLSARPTKSMAIADLRGDAESETVVLTEDGLMHFLDSDGDRLVDAVPIPESGCSSPFIADLTGDGALEACVTSCVGQVFAFGFGGTADEPVVEWQGLGGNLARNGIHVQPFAGSIAAGATLSGRYLITGDVTIEADALVSILPDATIEFDGNAHPVLEVYGQLNALGHPGSEIAFRPDEDRRSGGWTGIYLRPGSTATLTSCLISGADVGIRGNQASLTVAGSSVHESAVGARLAGCSLDASTSSFSHSDSLGMYLSGGDGIIIDCVFDGNSEGGLWCDNYASHELMRDAFINTTDGDGLRCYRYSSVSVDTCTISQNAGHGALVFTSSPSFNSCTIADNALNGALCKRMAMPKFCWNTISGNAIGIVAESGSNPHVGDGINDDTGYNSIMNNTVAAVANYTSNEAPISVRYNWWGTYPPVGRIFIGDVRYYPCLQQPPENGTGGRSAEDLWEEAAPSMFRLGHCAPNPFNPVTSVDYDVPDAGGPVNISVFDVAGRLVTTLYSGYHDPGTHSVTWDGRDDRGRDVASGIYFVRLDAMDYRASRKMVLLK